MNLKKLAHWQINNLILIYACLGVVSIAVYDVVMFYLGFVILIFGIYYQSKEFVSLLNIKKVKKVEEIK